MASDLKNLSSPGDFTKNVQTRWLKDLLSPGTRLELRLMNLSGRLRMPRNWVASSPGLSEHLFYYVAEGGFEGTAGGRSVALSAGDMIWIEPGVPFSFQMGNFASLAVWRFRLNLLRRKRPVAAPEPVCLVSPAKNCLRWMEAIVDESSTDEPWLELRLKGLLASLTTEIFHNLIAVQVGAGELSRGQKNALIAAVEQAGHKRLRVNDLARVVQLSPDYFTRCFRRSFGLPPRRWLVEQRMRHAALRLLESDMRVGEIAGEFGYPDVFAFSKQFKLITGSSPLAYREDRGRLLAKI